MTGLIGRTLSKVDSDGWAAVLGVDDYFVKVVPEEIHVPSETNPHAEVTRPKFVAKSGYGPQREHMCSLALSLGMITEVRKARVAVSFAPPVEVGPTEILGVEIPAGSEYEPLFYSPSATDEFSDPDGFTELDVAVQIKTDQERKVTLFTDGISFFVYAAVDHEPEVGWGGIAEAVPLISTA